MIMIVITDKQTKVTKKSNNKSIMMIIKTKIK